jgi:quinoprotein glucose dehydrogenase
MRWTSCAGPVTVLLGLLVLTERGRPGPPAAVGSRWSAVGGLPPDSSLRLADGLVAETFAADPHLANPVAIAVDDQGRLLVAETHRYLSSVFDITQQPAWLRDDLQMRSVEDRRRFLERTFADQPELLVRDSERIRVLVDDDGDGRADRSRVLADGFDQVVAGTAAGILAFGPDLWFACVPDLVRLAAADIEGDAGRPEVLHSGYGVHIGVTGHDLHGLAIGPDGRLYFSMGDRGAKVRSREGRWIDLSETGAVFRCEPDGSALEVVAVGLRNPQELAFDADGNLFTVDNDTAGDDRSRVLHLVAGGDYGWRFSYQHMEGFGPWVREAVWEGGIDGFLPGAGFAAQGPAGLDFHPGTGFDPAERGRFVVCDFPKGVLSFGLDPRGASFAVAEPRWLIEDIWAPDATFGPDGALWVADWIAGWGRPDAGRVHRVFRDGVLDTAEVREVRELLRAGLGACASEQLLDLLGHADLRLRSRAHLELATRREAWPQLARTLALDPRPRVRLHALWALGVAARRHGGGTEAVVAALADAEPLVRSRAARLCGELGLRTAAAEVAGLLADPQPAVQLEAGLALAQIGDGAQAGAVRAFLARSGALDAFLLHAGVAALAAVADRQALAGLAADPDPALRRAALLALRRSGAAEVALFLDDPLPGLRVEAARAIHDLPIDAARPALAARLGDEGLPAAALGRAIAAARFLGRAEDADALAACAADPRLPAADRVRALRALASFAAPDPVDPVVGLWRVIAPRDPAPARRALAERVEAFASAGPTEVAIAFVDAVRELGIGAAATVCAAWAADPAAEPGLRGAALLGLAEFGAAAPELGAAVEASLGSGRVELVEPALRLATRIEDLDAGLVDRIAGLARGEPDLGVRRAAIRALGSLSAPAATATLRDLLAGLDALPGGVRLDVLEAAERRSEPEFQALLTARSAALDPGDPLAPWRVGLDGGDPARGRALFAERAELACLRCHAVGGTGGTLGPALDRIGASRTAEELLESLLFPAARVTEGFPAAMPDLARHLLSRAEVRDLIAYLRSLR